MRVWRRMGRTGKNPTVRRSVNGLTNIWKYSFARPESDADYFRNGTGLRAHARPSRKRDLLCEWEILGVPDRLPCSFKGIDGHRVGGRNSARHLAGWKARDVHHAPARQRSELWVSDIDGGNKVKIATGESLSDGDLGAGQFSLVLF